MAKQNWPSAISNIFVATAAAVIIAGFLAWTLILPTVGLLYFLGALA